MTTRLKDQVQAVAWIGVGKMGLPIAGRMVETGIRVTGYDSGKERMVLAQQHGLQTAGSAAEAAANHSVVFTSLPDDAALRAVVLGPDGLLNKLASGTVLIETSTVSAEISTGGRPGPASVVTFWPRAVPGNGGTASRNVSIEPV